jgi:formyl-CoA transferase
VLCDIIGRPEAVNDPRFSNPEARFLYLVDLDELLSPWFAAHGNAEIFEVTGRRGVPVGPASTTADLRISPQLRERAAFDRAPGGIEFPALPLKVAGGSRARPGDWAPSVGRDTDRVIAWLDGGAPRTGFG